MGENWVNNDTEEMKRDLAAWSHAVAAEELAAAGGSAPAGEAVDVPAVKSIPPHATLLQDLQSVAMGEIEDNPVANIAMSALNLIKLLKSEHAAALARAQTAEGEAARLQNQIHLYKDAANLAGMQYGLERENSHLLYRILEEVAPDTLTKIKGRLNHSNTEGDKVLGEYTRRVQDMSIALKPFADAMVEWEQYVESGGEMSLVDYFTDYLDDDALRSDLLMAHKVYTKYLK